MSETAELFTAGLQRLGQGDLAGYLDTFSEDIVFEFPFAPPGRPARVQGRDELRRYLEPMLGLTVFEGLTNLVVYETDVAETIVVEMALTVRPAGSPESSPGTERRYVAVVHAEDGHIDSYRDYWNPLTSISRTPATDAP